NECGCTVISERLIKVWGLGPGGSFVRVLLLGAAALALIALVAASMRFAMGLGEKRGRAAERERHRRDVHDNVLQVMESLALPAPADVFDPAASLDRVRRTARAYALRLRLSLDTNTSTTVDGLVHLLRALAIEMAVEGLRVEVVATSALELPE